MPFRPFKQWLIACCATAWLSGHHTPSSSAAVGRRVALGPWQEAQHLSDGSQNPHTQMGRDSGKLARCPARQAHPWTALVRGTQEAFPGALQGQGAAAENTGHPEPVSLWSSQCVWYALCTSARKPSPLPQASTGLPGVTAAYSTSGPGSSGDSEHHLSEALEGGFARGRLLGFSAKPPYCAAGTGLNQERGHVKWSFYTTRKT